MRKLKSFEQNPSQAAQQLDDEGRHLVSEQKMDLARSEDKRTLDTSAPDTSKAQGPTMRSSKSDDRQTDMQELIDRFSNEIDKLGSASLETQRQVLALLQGQRSRLLARTGRPTNIDRDRRVTVKFFIRQAQGLPIGKLYEALAAEFHISPERVKSIVQSFALRPNKVNNDSQPIRNDC
jgi:hypothetical protein